MASSSSRQRTPLLLAVGLAMFFWPQLARTQPPPPVPPGHPRVYVTAADVVAMQQKMGDPQYAGFYDELSNCDYSVCYAFRYLMGEPGSVGDLAVSTLLNELGHVVENWENCEYLRKINNPVHYAALVYDWCFDRLSLADRQSIINEILRITSFECSPVGFPYEKDVNVTSGHGSESWLLSSQLPAGVAIYDEEPSLYQAAASFFLEKYVPVRDFHYASHMHHQGDSYITSRFQNDMLAAWLFRRMGAPDVFDPTQGQVPYQIIYNLRPDYQQLRSGDTWNSDGRARDKRRILLLTGSYYDDGFFMTMVNAQVGNWPLYHFLSFEDEDVYHNSSLDRIFEFLFRDPAATELPIESLPKTRYFPSPMGEMVARTGWSLGIDSHDAVVNMRIGDTFFGNHQRKDFGTWQIYYRGALAITSGYYQHQGCNKPHYKNYYQQTVAHNGLLVFNPEEVMLRDNATVANDGGQQWPDGGRTFATDLDDILQNGFRRAKVTAHQAGPDELDPHYSYIAGDITDSYSAATVSRVTRSMVTFRTNEVSSPAVFIVFDRVTSLAAEFEKRWLLHSLHEPTVDGKKIVVVQDEPAHGDGSGQYGGKLVVHSLLPQSAAITKVGGEGKEFWIANPDTFGGGTNWMWDLEEEAPKDQHEVGSWRVEVSPLEQTMDDRFLHAMVVQDSATLAESEATGIHSEELAGAKLADHAALFSRDGSALEEASFEMPGAGSAHTLVCDLEAGSWCVKRGDTAVTTASVSSEGGCIFFEATPGDYVVEKGGDCSSAPIPDAGAPVDASAGGHAGAGGAGDGGVVLGAGGAGSATGGCDCALQGAPARPVALWAWLMGAASLACSVRRRARSAGGRRSSPRASKGSGRLPCTPPSAPLA